MGRGKVSGVQGRVCCGCVSVLIFHMFNNRVRTSSSLLATQTGKLRIGSENMRLNYTVKVIVSDI